MQLPGRRNANALIACCALLFCACDGPRAPSFTGGGDYSGIAVRSEALPATGLASQSARQHAFPVHSVAPPERTWLYVALLITGLLTGLTGLAFIKFYALSRSLQAEIKARRTLEEELKELAITDPGTELLNRRGLFQALAEALALGSSPLSLLVIDLDHFKEVNDTYGHAGGDRVLREFARICQDIVRPGAALGRLGGEEFAVVLPGTGLDKARRIAERIREAVALRAIPVSKGGTIEVTVSVGLAVHREEETLDALMVRADSAMYEAKCLGRNRVVVAADFNQTARLALQRERARSQSRHSGVRTGHEPESARRRSM